MSRRLIDAGPPDDQPSIPPGRAQEYINIINMTGDQQEDYIIELNNIIYANKVRYPYVNPDDIDFDTLSNLLRDYGWQYNVQYYAGCIIKSIVRYQLDQLNSTQIGSGSFGHVYKLDYQNKGMDKFWIKKVMRSNPNSDNRVNFYTEAAVSSKINHLHKICPNFPYTYFFGIVNGQKTIFQERVHGEPLGKFIESNDNDSQLLTTLINIYRQVMLALTAAMRIGFTHYDLHIENVMIIDLQREHNITYFDKGSEQTITTRYLAKIIDFGTSRVYDEITMNTTSNHFCTGNRGYCSNGLKYPAKLPYFYFDAYMLFMSISEKVYSIINQRHAFNQYDRERLDVLLEVYKFFNYKDNDGKYFESELNRISQHRIPNFDEWRDMNPSNLIEFLNDKLGTEYNRHVTSLNCISKYKSNQCISLSNVEERVDNVVRVLESSMNVPSQVDNQSVPMEISKSNVRQGSVRQGSVRQGSVRQGSVRQGSAQSNVRQGSVQSNVRQGSAQSNVRQGSAQSNVRQGSAQSNVRQDSVRQGSTPSNVRQGSVRQGSAQSNVRQGSVRQGSTPSNLDQAY